MAGGVSWVLCWGCVRCCQGQWCLPHQVGSWRLPWGRQCWSFGSRPCRAPRVAH